MAITVRSKIADSRIRIETHLEKTLKFMFPYILHVQENFLFQFFYLGTIVNNKEISIFIDHPVTWGRLWYGDVLGMPDKAPCRIPGG